MTFEARFVVIVLAAFAWSSLAAAIVVPALVRRLRADDPAERARRLLRLRAQPALVGLAAAVLAATAFLLFEPRGLDENYGVVLRSLAFLSLVLLGVSAGRAALVWLATRRLMRTLIEHAVPTPLAGISIPTLVIDSAFPIVAVVGVVRPRLIVARSVLTECSPDELLAILAHERAHIERRDNLARVLLGAMPDVLTWLPFSTRLATAWQESAEHAADDEAGRHVQEGRLVLAEALIRVARLAPPAATLPLLTSALYRGEDLTSRVERLMRPLPPATSASRRARWAASLGLVVCAATLEAVHELVEVAVAFLP